MTYQASANAPIDICFVVVLHIAGTGRCGFTLFRKNSRCALGHLISLLYLPGCSIVIYVIGSYRA